MNSTVLARENLLRLLQGPGIERVAGTANLLLVLLAAYLLAQLTWRLVPAPTLPQPRARAQTAAAATARVAPAAPISAWHLFGKASSGTRVAGRPLNAPETHLSLVLSGVLSSGDPKIARAIIADSNGVENDYAVGAELPEGAKLSRIYPDRVILRRDGRYETLKLPEQQMVVGNGNGAEKTPAETRHVGLLLRRYRNALSVNPSTLLQVVRPQEVVKNGHFVGFRLRPGERPALLGELGLRSGDVVTAIDGVKLTSPATSISALAKLRGADSFTLTVQRGGRQINLPFHIP